MGKDVLFEIGLEELPAGSIDDAEKQLKNSTENWLNESRISFEQIDSFSTPRRLAIIIHGMAETQTTIEEEAKGPTEKIAKDEDGNWSKAAFGFTKGQGKTTDDIYIKEVKGTNYIFVNKLIEGKPVKEFLPNFKEIIESISFEKNMRWGSESLRYIRPIRWLTALFGEEVIPFEIAGVESGNITFGHRFLGDKIELAHPSDYQDALRRNYVIADPKEREDMITDQIKQMEESRDFQTIADQNLLDEVRNLVEYPTVFAGDFDERYLNLPQEVLVISMKEHQRYFPVKSKSGKLLPHFISVRNGDAHKIENVARGNEKVLRARLADAEFFYAEDHKNTISDYQKKLERVVFQEKIGTISEKVQRVTRMTEKIAAELELDEETTKTAARAAEICKFDLVTLMVDEFSQLQGVIGEKYALDFGESESTAAAIREHYLPIQASGDLPESTEGSIVSIADKLDTIVGCISVGLIPTGSQDPYGLRRQATGILRIVSKNKWNVSLEKLLEIAQNLYQSTDIENNNPEETKKQIHEFFILRATYLLKEMNIEQDIIHAVLHQEIGVFYYTIEKAKMLSAKRNDPDFKSVQEALVRTLNLAVKTDKLDVDADTLQTDSEQNLFRKFQEAKPVFLAADADKDAEKALQTLSQLQEAIHVFFDNNMVMADDEKIRNNRLALINNVGQLINKFADLRQIEWKQHF